MTRRELLTLTGSALLLSACERRDPGTLRIAADGTDIPPVVTAVYAAALTRAGIPVRSTEAAEADIRIADAAEGTRLALIATPATIAPCVVTSQYAAEQFWLLTLEKCASIAPRLRLAATPEFLAAGGQLDVLRRRYGGFRFKDILPFAPGAQYDAVSRGDADVANGSTVDGSIAEQQFVVLRDDRHTWHKRHVVPVITNATVLAKYPSVAAVLNCASRALTQYAVQGLTMRASLQSVTIREVADDFVERLRCKPDAVTMKRG